MRHMAQQRSPHSLLSCSSKPLHLGLSLSILNGGWVNHSEVLVIHSVIKPVYFLIASSVTCFHGFRLSCFISLVFMFSLIDFYGDVNRPHSLHCYAVKYSLPHSDILIALPGDFVGLRTKNCSFFMLRVYF